MTRLARVIALTLAPVLVLGIAMLALPAWLGWRIETRYWQALATLDAAGARIRQAEYRRGWRASEALARIAMPLALDAVLPGWELEFVAQARHDGLAERLGEMPAGWPALARLHARARLLGSGRAWPALQPALQIDATIAPTGRWNMNWRLPDTTAPNGTAEALSSDIISGGLRGRGPTGEAWGEARGLEWSAPQPASQLLFAARGMRWHADWTVTAGHRRASLLFELDGLQLLRPDPVAASERTTDPARNPARNPAQDPAPDPAPEAMPWERMLSLTDLRLTGTASMRDSTSPAVDLAWHGALSRLMWGELALDDARLVASLSDLAPDAFTRLPQVWEAMRAAALAPTGETLGDALRRLMIEDWLPLALQRPAPRFQIETLELRVPGGTLAGAMRVELASPPDDPQGGAPDLSAWLRALAGEAEFALPESFVFAHLAEQQRRRALAELAHRGRRVPTGLEQEIARAASAALEALVAQDWLRRDGNRLFASLALADGWLRVNQRALPLAESAP